jgi:hypothetical protein
MGKRDQSIALLQEILKRRKAKLGPDHADTLDAQADLIDGCAGAGRFADALPLLEELYQRGRENPDLARVDNPFLINLAAGYLAVKRPERAIPLYEAVLTKQKEQLGSDDPRTLATLGNLADAYRGNGRPADAVDLFEELIRLRTAREGAGSILLAGHKVGLAEALLYQKKLAEAEPLLRAGLAIRAEQQPGTWLVAATQGSLGEALAGQRKYAEAEPLLLAAYTGLERGAASIPARWRDRPVLLLERLVQFYEAWGKPAEAAKWRKELQETEQ